MDIAIYVAIAENGVIGRDGGLPWRLSADMRRFKADTMGKPVVMGRKTWESFPRRPLPGRLNVVITRDKAFRAEGAEVVHSLADAMTLATTRGRCGAADERQGEDAGQARAHGATRKKGRPLPDIGRGGLGRRALQGGHRGASVKT